MIDLDALEAALAAATPGPWDRDGRRVLARDERKTIVAEVTGAVSNPSTVADATLIAAIPDLIAELRRLREAEREAEVRGATWALEWITKRLKREVRPACPACGDNPRTVDDCSYCGGFGESDRRADPKDIVAARRETKR